jgi:hypothetical protein
MPLLVVTFPNRHSVADDSAKPMSSFLSPLDDFAGGNVVRYGDV